MIPSQLRQLVCQPRHRPGVRVGRPEVPATGEAGGVLFGDMAQVGANPARIIPAWHEFVTRNAAPGRRMRGIGEPIWNGRSSDELVECQRHESLLNVAFGRGEPWWLLCPYDVENLEPAVIFEARRRHEFVSLPRKGDGKESAKNVKAHPSSGGLSICA